MSNQTQTARVRPILATNPTIYNLSMPLANTEYSQVLNNSTKKIMIRMRVKAKSRFAFTVNGTTSNYITIEGGSVYFEENLDLTGAILYIQSNQAGNTAEILEWV